VVGLLVAVGLFGLIGGCGDDDESGPPPTGPYTGKDAAEASIGVAFTTFEVISGIFDGIPDLGGFGPKTAPVGRPSLSLRSVLDAAAAAKDRVLAAAGGAVPCEGGGTQDVSCTATETSSHLSGVFSNCVDDTSGVYTTTINGSITVDVQDPLACGYKGLPDSVGVTIAFDNFSIVVKDSQEVTVDSFTADLTIVMEPSGAGCDGQDGTIRINGTMDRLSLLEGLDISLAADNLIIVKSTIAEGDTCSSILLINGGAALSNGQQSFSNDFVDLRYLVKDLLTYFSITVNGTVSTNCTGALTYETILPILANPDDECPFAGTLRVVLADDTLAKIFFTDSGGVTLDYPEDGTPDDDHSSCEDSDIAQCVY
jgi:hypothetical protein